MFFKKHDDTVDIVLHPFRKFYPPCLKLISVFNCPIFVHTYSIAYFLYRGQSSFVVPFALYWKQHKQLLKTTFSGW